MSKTNTQKSLHYELLSLRSKEKNIGHEIIEKLQLMEENQKYLSLGYSSLFDYLVRGLGYSESAAYRRQSCVRLSKELPEVKEKMKMGTLTPGGLGMAFKSLRGKATQEKRRILKTIENKSTREIKKILLQHEEVTPKIKVQKTEYKEKVILRLELSHEQNSKLERLKALSAHKLQQKYHSSSQLENLMEYLIDKELKIFKNTDYKSGRSQNPRFVSQTLRNDLIQKADYKCQFPGCKETHFLQVDHIKPVRLGGKSTRENLQILCGAHNRMKG